MALIAFVERGKVNLEYIKSDVRIMKMSCEI